MDSPFQKEMTISLPVKFWKTLNDIYDPGSPFITEKSMEETLDVTLPDQCWIKIAETIYDRVQEASDDLEAQEAIRQFHAAIWKTLNASHLTRTFVQ